MQKMNFIITILYVGNKDHNDDNTNYFQEFNFYFLQKINIYAKKNLHLPQRYGIFEESIFLYV